MRYNQIGNKAFLVLLLCGPYVLSSQQPCVSTDILKSIMTLQRHRHEKYRLYSSRDWQKGLERQLVVELKPFEKKSQSFSCFRIDSENLLLLSAQTKVNGRVVVASCHGKADVDSQLEEIGSFFNKWHDKIKDVKVLVLNCEKDAGISYVDKSFWDNYKEQLRQMIGVEPEMIGYNMIRGQDYREKDHFECQIDSNKVVWRSAIDHFQKHNL